MLRLLVESWVNGASDIKIVRENPSINVTINQPDNIPDDIDSKIFGKAIISLLESVKQIRRGEQIEFDEFKKTNWDRADTYHSSSKRKEWKADLNNNILNAYNKSYKRLSPEIKNQVDESLTYLNQNQWSLAETDKI